MVSKCAVYAAYYALVHEHGWAARTGCARRADSSGARGVQAFLHTRERNVSHVHDSAPRISSEFNLRGHCRNLARTRARHLARRVRGQSGGEQNCDVILSSVVIQGFVTGRVGRGELCFDVQCGVETGRARSGCWGAVG